MVKNFSIISTALAGTIANNEIYSDFLFTCKCSFKIHMTQCPSYIVVEFTEDGQAFIQHLKQVLIFKEELLRSIVNSSLR